MFIIGPRETHDYRNYNPLESGTNTPPPKKLKMPHVQHICAVVNGLEHGLHGGVHAGVLDGGQHLPAHTAGDLAKAT